MRKGLVAVLAALGLALGQQQVTLFWSGAITGPTSETGAPYGAGIEDYCRHMARAIPGVVLSCVVRDDRYDNATTQRLFEEAVDRFKIPIYLGYGTGAMLQMKALIQELRIPTLPASNHVGLIDPPNGDYYLPKLLPTPGPEKLVTAML
ncbi:ABC transporter substrate-binding protein, partial [Thermus thalpophilus]